MLVCPEADKSEVHSRRRVKLVEIASDQSNSSPLDSCSSIGHSHSQKASWCRARQRSKLSLHEGVSGANSYCGEWNNSEVDESAGQTQEYVEDCQVCCQPNILRAQFNRREERFVIHAHRES